MLSPEFRAKLEDIMADWYAAQDAGEMHIADLCKAVADIAATYNPARPEMPAATAGLLGGLMGTMFLMKQPVVEGSIMKKVFDAVGNQPIIRKGETDE